MSCYGGSFTILRVEGDCIVVGLPLRLLESLRTLNPNTNLTLRITCTRIWCNVQLSLHGSCFKQLFVSVPNESWFPKWRWLETKPMTRGSSPFDSHILRHQSSGMTFLAAADGSCLWEIFPELPIQLQDAWHTSLFTNLPWTQCILSEDGTKLCNRLTGKLNAMWIWNNTADRVQPSTHGVADCKPIPIPTDWSTPSRRWPHAQKCQSFWRMAQRRHWFSDLWHVFEHVRVNDKNDKA